MPQPPSPGSCILLEAGDTFHLGGPQHGATFVLRCLNADVGVSMAAACVRSSATLMTMLFYSKHPLSTWCHMTHAVTARVQGPATGNGTTARRSLLPRTPWPLLPWPPPSKRSSRSSRHLRQLQATDRPLSRRRFMMPPICLTMSGESPSEGSSIRISSGFAISARPTANICCSPPESAPPECSIRSANWGNS